MKKLLLILALVLLPTMCLVLDSDSRQPRQRPRQSGLGLTPDLTLGTGAAIDGLLWNDAELLLYDATNVLLWK